ncbi:MAG: ABC transporter permease [Lachnospiraceae bacterium]|nr:ABC transporter permease [Lachnospiraceae bacterium]
MNKEKLKLKIIYVATIAAMIVVLTLFAGFFAPNDPYATSAEGIRMAPSFSYPFGTDNLGRCVFSRVLYGGRTTIGMTFLLVAIAFVIGTFVGMICGYFGGWLDRFLMRIADVTLAFPQMVIAIAVAGILGGGLWGVLLALGITMWVSFARLARSHTYSLKSQPYISAAILSGKSDFYILTKHILPNILAPLLTNALTQIGVTMIGISGLSFLGIGVQAPMAEWGQMIAEARAYIQIAPWAVLFPALAIAITIIVFNYLGDLIMDYREL